ncbi:MAG: hypothetical protein FWE36_07635 [Erysipelotrichales bacterium]|nr:hypothetical protein [Erysipelotrichales bacterium]
MQYRLKNNLLEATVQTKGAELKSLKYKNQELLLNDDAHWNYTSPFLFPIIGKLKNDYTFINNQEYKIPKHGLIRTADFVLEEQKNNLLRFSFTSPDEMLTLYPFKFKFTVTYFLDKRNLSTVLKVENLSADMMYFNLGLHPAFSTSAFNNKFQDYAVIFEKKETMKLPVIESNGTLNFAKVSKIVQNQDYLPLTYQDYENDALVYKNLKSRKVTLESKNYLIDFNFKNFSSLGIWTKVDAPFICLEPWIGHGDKTESDNQFMDKDDLVSLKPNKAKSFEFTFTIKKPEIEEK